MAGRTNRQQNQEFERACREAGRILGIDLVHDRARRERLHREISREGYTYEEIVEIALTMFGA